LAIFGLSSQPQGKHLPSGKKSPVEEIRSVEQDATEDGADSFEDIARRDECRVHKKYRAKTCEARDGNNHPEPIRARAVLLEEFGKTYVLVIYLNDPPIRGSFGSAEIGLKEGAVPVAQQPYRRGVNRERLGMNLSTKHAIIKSSNLSRGL